MSPEDPSSSSSSEDDGKRNNIGASTQEIFTAIIERVKKHEKTPPFEELVREEIADHIGADGTVPLETLLKDMGGDKNGTINGSYGHSAQMKHSLYRMGLLAVKHKEGKPTDLEQLIRKEDPEIDIQHVKGIIGKFNALRNMIKRDLDRHKDELPKTALENKTILHMIAESKSKGIGNLESLIGELMHRHPELALEQDRTKTTPLHAAIKNKERRIVRFMCDTLKGERLDEVLLIQDNNKCNCLHTAVAETKSNRITIELIKRVKSPETYCAKNDDGLTPMHLAVEFERCSARQLEVIDAMIERWDKALDVNVLCGESNRNLERSVYRHHQWTRLRATQKRSEKESTVKVTSTNPGITSTGKKFQEGSHPHMAEKGSPNLALIPMQAPSINANKLSYPQKLPRKPTMTDVTHEALDHSVNLLSAGGKNLEKSRDRAAKPGEKKSGKSEPLSNTDVARLVNTKPPEMSQEDAATEIGNKLKMHYMCTRDDHSQIISFLYEPNAVKEICLTLVGGPTVIDEARLEEMPYAKFDETLHYLELPNVKVSVSRGQKINSDDASKGRRDYETIFNWLRKKGVKNIIHLLVEDAPAHSHSDESIERALKDFKVIKTWEWLKTDIDSETLVKAAPSVREVVLYWSGNNAVLRGWGEAEGLHRLRNLEKITVHGTPGLESKKRAALRLEAFKQRMERRRNVAANDHGSAENLLLSRNDSLPKFEVLCDLDNLPQRQAGDAAPIRLAQEQQPEQHRWISALQEFNTYAKDLLEKESGTNPIRVALIDDGVDFTDKRVANMVYGGRSHYQRSQKFHANFWMSTDGHGTKMAGLIRTVCPMAKLFVVRLNEYRSDNGKRQIYAYSAAKAIRDAITEGVDIISMSWTIGADSDDEGLKRLNDAVEEAAKRNILMFCAASDEGVRLDTSFPGQSPSCFKIGAATTWGTAHKSVGTSNNRIDYIFPGHHVRTTATAPDKTNFSNGSSVATALAAGLVALILRCVQFAVEYLKENGRKEEAHKMESHLEALRTRKRMQQTFEMIGEHKINKTSYLEVWNVFKAASTKLDDEMPSRKREWVLRIANRLVQQRVVSA